MHHRMPPSKTGWPSLNMVIFLPVIRLVLDDPKQRPPRRLLTRFTSWSWKTAGFRLNQELSNWAFHVRGLGPTFMKIWTFGSSPRSGSLNVDRKRQRCQSSEQHLEFFRRDPDDFLPRLVTMDETWLYHYDPETKQHSMERRHSGSPGPQKIPSEKNPLEKFSPQIFGIKKASSSLITFQTAKLSMRNITHLCWYDWRTFWRKNATGRSPRWSCSWTTISRLTRHLQPSRNWPTWPSSDLITHPILRIWPHRTTTCSLDWKINWNVAIFPPTRRSLLQRRPGWTDNLLIFLSGLYKLEQWAKKCIELRGECVE